MECICKFFQRNGETSGRIPCHVTFWQMIFCQKIWLLCLIDLRDRSHLIVVIIMGIPPDPTAAGHLVATLDLDVDEAQHMIDMLKSVLSGLTDPSQPFSSILSEIALSSTAKPSLSSAYSQNPSLTSHDAVRQPQSSDLSLEGGGSFGSMLANSAETLRKGGCCSSPGRPLLCFCSSSGQCNWIRAAWLCSLQPVQGFSWLQEAWVPRTSKFAQDCRPDCHCFARVAGEAMIVLTSTSNSGPNRNVRNCPLVNLSFLDPLLSHSMTFRVACLSLG